MDSLLDAYSKEDKQLMQVAEVSRLIGKNRVEEIKLFAQNTGYKKIGIANCIKPEFEVIFKMQNL